MRGERSRRLAYPQADSALGAIPAPAQRSQRRYLDRSCSSRKATIGHLIPRRNAKLFTELFTATRRHLLRRFLKQIQIHLWVEFDGLDREGHQLLAIDATCCLACK